MPQCAPPRFDNLHTTELGTARVRQNLNLGTNTDITEYCRNLIQESDAIKRDGKNLYIKSHNTIITVNANSQTIITAHKDKK